MTSTAFTDGTQPRPQVRRRKVRHDFHGTEIPKHWHGGSVVATQLSNGVNLLFPEGERFFVRSVRRYLEKIQAEDAALAEEMKGFFGQEGSHAREHERFFEVLEEQGYQIREYVAAFTKSVRYIEKRSPPQLRLAATAAAEHFTALMARGALGPDSILEEADPLMRDFLRWHAAEEIEHKAVAFDVLQKVAPSYLLRLAGLAIAAGFLMYWWQRATRMLIQQDKLPRGALRADIKKVRAGKGGDRRILKDVFLKGALEYAKPSFHPWDHDDAHLAKRVTEELFA